MSTHIEFYCPITLEIMADPVVAVDGFSYERQAIESWFAHGHSTSPRTGLPLPSTKLATNHTLKVLISEWRAKDVRLPGCLSVRGEHGEEVYRPGEPTGTATTATVTATGTTVTGQQRATTVDDCQ
jgi:hypothetical protein